MQQVATDWRMGWGRPAGRRQYELLVQQDIQRERAAAAPATAWLTGSASVAARAGRHPGVVAALAAPPTAAPPPTIDLTQSSHEDEALAQSKLQQAKDAGAAGDLALRCALQKLERMTAAGGTAPSGRAGAAAGAARSQQPQAPLDITRKSQALRTKVAATAQQVAAIQQQSQLRRADITQQGRAVTAAAPHMPPRLPHPPKPRGPKGRPTPALEEDDEIVLLSSDEEAPGSAPAVHADADVIFVSDQEEGSEEQGEEGEGEEAQEEEGEEEEEEEEGAYSEDDALAARPAGLPKNSPAELAAWQDVLSRRGSEDTLVAEHARTRIPVSLGSLRTLRDGTWLNDEVINCSMALLQERDTQLRERHGSRALKCHFFNSFFLNKLFKDARRYSYDGVGRWTTSKKLALYGQASPCLLECDRLIVPVHVGTTHWACAMVDLRGRRLVYWDSLRGGDGNVLGHLAQWVVDEAAAKLAQGAPGADVWAGALDWPRECPRDVPQQHNGCDCGVFAIMFASFAGLGRPFSFSQKDMPTARRRILHDLIKMKWHS